MQREGISKYQGYYLKDGCEAIDDVMIGESSNDKETRS